MDVRREESKNAYFTKYQHRVSYYSHWITNPKFNSDLELITCSFVCCIMNNSNKKLKVWPFLFIKKLELFKLLLKLTWNFEVKNKFFTLNKNTFRMVKLFYNISLRNYYFIMISNDKSILNYYIKMGYQNTLLSSSKIVRNMILSVAFTKLLVIIFLICLPSTLSVWKFEITI